MKTFSYTFNNGEKYVKLQLPSNKVSEIIKVEDSDSNIWYEVESLAQETIFISEKNPNSTSEETPYLLKLLRTTKRFEVEIDENNMTYLLFGAGTESYTDEQLIPSPDNVLRGIENNIDVAISPENFLKAQTFGEAPHDTTLTIYYRESNGASDNSLSGEITDIKKIIYDWPIDTNILDSTIVKNIKKSVSLINNTPIVGAKSTEDVLEIKEKADASIFSQKRCVVKNDFIIRTLSLPSRYGSIAKVYVEKVNNYVTRKLDNDDKVVSVRHDIVIHVLSFDLNGKLTIANNDTKENLKTYLSQYRMLSDSIHIVNGKIVNFGIKFKIRVKNSYNKAATIVNVINKLSDFFNIKNINFNQMIVVSDIYELINNTNGVLNVSHLEFFPRYGGIYANNAVDFDDLMHDGIIYPPNDISIFELKYPKKDIIGQAI